MKWRLVVAYRGGAYAGWQRQRNALAVQQVFEEALGGLLGSPPRVVAAGRTDRGVHAAGQVVSVTVGKTATARSLVHGTNAYLPDDVRVLEAEPVGSAFDARRSARCKAYRYRLRTCEVLSPLEAPYVVRVAGALDRRAMIEAARALVGRHDFSAFALAGGSHRQPRRRILSAEWTGGSGELQLSLIGDGFLRGMVRSIVGTLLEVGQGRRPAADLGRLLSGRPRSEAGPTAPAHGLTLVGVRYDDGWLPRGEPARARHLGVV